MKSGFCYTCGKLRKMKRKGRVFVCIKCNTESIIFNDRLEIIVKKGIK